MKKNRHLFPDKLNTKHVCCLFLFALGCWLNLWNNCFAKPAETPLSVTPIRVGSNQLVLKGSELCPKSLKAINTQLSPSGDVLVWCAEAPSSKQKTPVKRTKNGSMK